MNIYQKRMFLKYATQYCLDNNKLKLRKEDRLKATHLFEERGRQWSTNPTKDIEDIAQSIGLKHSDWQIIEMTQNIWTDI